MKEECQSVDPSVGHNVGTLVGQILVKELVKNQNHQRVDTTV